MRGGQELERQMEASRGKKIVCFFHLVMQERKFLLSLNPFHVIVLIVPIYSGTEQRLPLQAMLTSWHWCRECVVTDFLVQTTKDASTSLGCKGSSGISLLNIITQTTISLIDPLTLHFCGMQNLGPSLRCCCCP